jgi:hypothetical protein
LAATGLKVLLQGIQAPGLFDHLSLPIPVGGTRHVAPQRRVKQKSSKKEPTQHQNGAKKNKPIERSKANIHNRVQFAFSPHNNAVVQAHFSPKTEEAGTETEEFHELGRNL